MLLHGNLPQQRSFVASCFLCMVLAILPGCAVIQSGTTGVPNAASASSWPPPNPPAGFFLPAGFFSKAAGDQKPTVVAPGMIAPAASDRSFVPSTPSVPEVLLYASPTTQAYFAAGGLDAKVNIRLWEVFLSKYKIPSRVVASVEQLEKSQPGVLLLPSAVALSEREKKVVIDFRAKGGSVLASWLTGVRGENGEWRGFDFMENALDVKVVGNTEATENDNFMMPHGDNPVTHHLPAGLRVWLERAKDWYPLRLVGRHAAAQIMDWSRTFSTGKPTTTIVFDELAQSSGHLSRSVVLGYPERLWYSADPKLLEAIAHNSLMWLLRQPDAYISAWPYPYSSAFVMTVEAVDVIADIDLAFAKSLEDAGGRASYYLLGVNVAKSAEMLKKIQARGHELAYLGDRFEGFKDQTSVVQAKRLDDMRTVMKEAGLVIGADAGFRAPMESYDKTTEKLLRERDFGHYGAFMDATDARLPFIAPTDAGIAKPGKAVVVLPRTQSGPEESMEEGDPEVGLKNFLNELELAEQMGGVSVVRIPNQSLLTNEQLAEVFKHLKARHDRMWLATARQVAEWWRERERVSARLESTAAAPLLTVTIKGEGQLKQAATVWVNLPESGTSLRLVARGSDQKSPKIASVDAWRAAVVLEGLAPGEYQWHLYFDRPIASGTK